MSRRTYSWNAYESELSTGVDATSTTINVVSAAGLAAPCYLVLDPESSDTVVQAETDASQAYAFTTPALAPGKYQIIAGTDLDDDGFICDIEDACGSDPELVTVVPGRNTRGIDFVLTTIASPQGIPSNPLGLGTKRYGRIR